MIFVTLHGAWNLSIRDAQGVTKKVNNPVAEALAFEEGTFHCPNTARVSADGQIGYIS